MKEVIPWRIIDPSAVKISFFQCLYHYAKKMVICENCKNDFTDLVGAAKKVIKLKLMQISSVINILTEINWNMSLNMWF